MAQPQVLAQANPVCAPGGTNLVGWWPGDNHTYNVVNQKAATVQGAVTYAPGVAGNAFQLNGTGKVRIPEPTSIDLSRTNRWTITAWVKPATIADSTGSAIGGVTTDDATTAFAGAIDEITFTGAP